MEPPRKKTTVNCYIDQPSTLPAAAAGAASSPAADQLTDMPPEILWIILKEAAILSSTADIDADFQHVLTSLARVCRRFYQVVRDPDFYRKFLRELLARDVAQSCRRRARAVELSLPGVIWGTWTLVWSRLGVLEDELFFVAADWRSLNEISVFDLKPLDGHDRSRDRDRDRTCSIKLVHLRTISAPVAAVEVFQSCDMNQCLYISPREEPHGTLADDIYRVSPVDGRVLAHWTLGGQINAGHMSVCQCSGHVCLPDAVNGRIVEFDADGRQTRLIDVSGIVPMIKQYTGNRTDTHQRYVFNVTQTADSTYLVSYNFREMFFYCKHAVIRARQQTVDGEMTLDTQVSAKLRTVDGERPECFIFQDDASRCIYTMGFDANCFGNRYDLPAKTRRCEMIMIRSDLTPRRRVQLLSRRRPDLLFPHQLRFDSSKCRLYAMIDGMLLCYIMLRDEFE